MNALSRAGVTSALVIACALALAPASLADEEIVSDTYTLDGKATTLDDARATGHVCSAVLKGSTLECYSSSAVKAKISAEALRNGTLPPGWLALPPEADRKEWIKRFDAEGVRGGTSYPPSAGADAKASFRATAATKKKPKKSGLKARKADFYQCNGATATRVYIGPSFTGGAPAENGYTGAGNWANYGSPFNTDITSFWAMNSYTSRWHDYYFGQGAYYGNGFACRAVEDLGNTNMSDGGNANNRFSSVAT